MNRDPAAPAVDDEHYVVDLSTFNALSGLADAINGVAALTEGRIGDRDPEESRRDLAALFRTLGQQLAAHLDGMIHQHGSSAGELSTASRRSES